MDPAGAFPVKAHGRPWRTLCLKPLLFAALIAGCAQPDEGAKPEAAAARDAATQEAPAVDSNPNRNAYFGDLHVHTFYSLDAFIFGTRATPHDAYRYAKGESLGHPAGFEMQLGRPLDFQAVTDHATYLGILPAMADPASSVGTHPLAMALRNARTESEKLTFFLETAPGMLGSDEGADLLDMNIVSDAWRDIVETAERHNDPGAFTTFIGYEYTTSGPGGANLHRNVIFRGSDAPDLPFSTHDSRNPEDLWDWMDGLRALGIESLAIPHNPNRSNGMMFETTDQGRQAHRRGVCEPAPAQRAAGGSHPGQGHLRYAPHALAQRRMGRFRHLQPARRLAVAQPAQRRLRTRCLAQRPGH